MGASSHPVRCQHVAVEVDRCAEDKITVWTKTQGVKDTQNTISQTFKIPLDNGPMASTCSFCMALYVANVNGMTVIGNDL